jgi:DNA topoisomerase IB
MSKRYCFLILNKDKKFDIDKLLEYISDLYTDNSEEKDKLSFIPYYAKGIDSDNVCIEMSGRGKGMIAKIEKINKMIGQNPSKLTWNGIKLSEPYEFKDIQEQGFPLKLEKTKGQKRWSSIIQRGPYFKEIMEPYVPLNASLSINGKIYKLTPKEEKVAGFYATRIRADAKDIAKTQYTKLEKFNQNFWKDFQTYLTPKAKSIFKSYDDFLQIDWSDLVDKLEQKTLVEKELAKTKEEKDRKKQKTAQIKSEYGYAILDGKPLQKIGNYQVEISGIFLGKKGHPKLGRIKNQIMPEDVTINIGENDPKPKAPLGHTWAKVVNDYTRVWLASWKDEINNKIKYIWFSPEGVFKAQSDFNKYEKARKLHFQIEEIRTNYMKLTESPNMIKKQIGTVLFLIDHFGIRIGNETDSDKSDPVVGATTLLVSNINVDKKNIVIFDFEGKDNVRFYKELEVPENIYKNFKELKEGKGKKGHNQIFDQISSENVNDYLKDIDPSFTAKVFRTRLASEIMYNALQELPPIASKSTKTDIKKEFNKANIKVAEVLNHVRTAAPNKSMETLKNSLKEAEKEKNTEKINKLTKQIEEKQVLMSVAINTSLVNYIDPRIIASWAKSQNVPTDSVYNTTLQAKFKWAINLINDKDDEWSWEDSPLEEGVEEGVEDVEEEVEESKKSRKEKISRPPPKTTPEPPAFKPSRPPPKTTPEPPAFKPSRLPPKTTPESDKIRKSYKMSTPRKITKNYEIEQEEKKDKLKTFKFKWEQNIVDSPNILESYKLLLELCENLKNGNNHNDELISKISPLVLKWVYPLSKEAINTGNGNYIANKYIIEYCDKEIFNSITSPTPTPPYPKHPLSAPIFSRTPFSKTLPTPSPTRSPTPFESLSERDISSLFRSSSSSSSSPPTPPPPPPPPKKQNNEDIKIMLDGTIVFITNKKTSGIKKISPEIAQKFTGLNTYTNDKDLKDFCIKNNIDYKGKTRREIKENIIEIYKDKKQKDIPI